MPDRVTKPGLTPPQSQRRGFSRRIHIVTTILQQLADTGFHATYRFGKLYLGINEIDT
jgi:hypothetical protein